MGVEGTTKVIRLVFLDFDGVLNSASYQRKISAELTDAEFFTRSSKLLDSDAIERLNRVLSATGAQVVVSSTWRVGMTVAALQSLLEERGFSGVVCGVTPRLHLERGAEIASWLDERKDEPEHAEGVRFVIFDDGEGMGDLVSRHVKTDGEVGLTENDCERAIELLS